MASEVSTSAPVDKAKKYRGFIVLQAYIDNVPEKDRTGPTGVGGMVSAGEYVANRPLRTGWTERGIGYRFTPAIALRLSQRNTPLAPHGLPTDSGPFADF